MKEKKAFYEQFGGSFKGDTVIVMSDLKAKKVSDNTLMMIQTENFYRHITVLCQPQ